MATAATTAESLVERLRFNPGSLVFPRLADHYRKTGDIDRAIELCTTGLTLHPDSITGHIVLGRCYLDQKNLENAIGALTNVCRLDRRNASAIKMLADIFMRQGLSKKAGDLYSILARTDPLDSRLTDISARHQGTGKNDLFEILGLTPGAAPSAVTSDRIVVQEKPSSKERAFPLDDAGFSLDAGAAVEEMLTEATTISGSDVSDRLTALFGEGPSAKAPPARTPLPAFDETVTSFPVKPQEAPTILPRREETSGKETIKMRAVNEPTKTGSPLEVELAETMIIDADAAMLLQGETGMAGIKVKDTSSPETADKAAVEAAVEAADAAIDDAKTQELVGGTLTQPADAFTAEELIEKPQESLEEILSDKPLTPATLQVEAATEATAAIQTEKDSAEDTISGDDVADRLDRIFEETKNKGQRDAPPPTAEKNGPAIAQEPAEHTKVLPQGMAVDSDIEKTASFLPAAEDTITGDDVAERLEGIFKEKKKQKKASHKDAVAPAAEATAPAPDKKEETDTSATKTLDKGSAAKVPATDDGSDSVIETASLSAVKSAVDIFAESTSVETGHNAGEENEGPERTVVELPPSKLSGAGRDQADQFEETLIFDTPEYVSLSVDKKKEPETPPSDKAQPPGDNEKESTAIFEEFSPSLVPAAPHVFEPASATPAETDNTANIDKNKNPDDLPDQVLTPTLANIYLQQGLPQSALKIYRRLAVKDPANTEFQQQIVELEKTIAAGVNNLKPPPPKRSRARKKNPRRQDAGEETLPPAGTRRPRKKIMPDLKESAGGEQG